VSTDATVDGERTVARVSSGRSLAVRAQRIVAIALVSAVGAGVLGWYYLSLAATGRANKTASTAGTKSTASSEMVLPPFSHLLPVPASEPVAVPSAAVPSAISTDGATGIVDSPPAAHGRAAPPSANDALARISSPVLIRPQAPAPEGTPGVADLAALVREAAGSDRLDRAFAAAAGAGASANSTPGPILAPAVEAALLPTRRWLLPKGAFLDCTLETAIDSTLAGMATCILATDAFGADGRVVLLERGTKLIGETRSDVRPGQARVAVLWAEARTPTGVVVTLTSPATDSLGRSGIPGSADTHFGARFGAAILVSLIDGTVAGIAARQQGAGTLVYNAQNSRDVATEVLRNTINIPPTIRVPPGERVQVLVARDVDFRRVYRLAAHTEP
jgi:type IV secretion system protein VirB10